MTYSNYVLQVQDLNITKYFFENIIGFKLINITTSLIHLKHEYSSTILFLISTNLLSLKGFGGIIYIIQSIESWNSTFNLAITANYQCKKLDLEGKTMIIEGPFGITIISTSSSDEKNINLSSSFLLLENILQNQLVENNDTSTLRITTSTSSPTNITLTPPPILTNFTTQIYDLKGYSNLVVNSRIPIPFESKSFSGIVLFLVRTKPLDPYYRHFFENNQRMYIIQVQGKFKKSFHSDNMYMGIESTCSMGMMSKGICRAMLKFLSNNNGGGTLRHSLGDAKNPSAFMSSTLVSAVDRLCITPINETPPPITCEFPESKDVKVKRRQKSFLFDTSSTYSFTIKGKNIDFCEWSTCGFRMINPTNLSTFIGNHPLRLVAYTEKKHNINKIENNKIDNNNESDTIQSHRRQGLSYFLEIEINSQISASSTQTISAPQQSDSDSETDDITNDINIEKQDIPEVSKNIERESFQISPEELIRSDRVLSVHLTKTSPEFIEGFNKRPVSSPPRSYSNAALIPKVSVETTNNNNSNNNNDDHITPDSISILNTIPNIPLTDNYMIAIPSNDEDENDVENNKLNTEKLENLYSSGINPSMRIISVKLERIVMEWTTEDMKYCPAAIEINDYRRGRNRRVAYVILKPNSPTRIRSYMQLAEIIPLLMVDDVESRSGRFTENELRRRQLAISLKKVSLLSTTDSKIESIWNGIFSNSNDLDEYFLKKVGQPRNRMNNIRITFDTEQINSRTNSEDHLFDQSNSRAPSPTITSFLSSSISSTTIRMEGSVAVCTGRRSWSEEWAVLTGKYFTIPTPQTAKHLRIPSIIPLGQIRSVNILSEIEKPFPGYEFFTIGTAARIYYFCVKNEYILSQWIDALLQYQLPPSFVSTNSLSSNKGIAIDFKDGLKNDQLLETINQNNSGMMGDNLPEEPEACIVNPGNFASSNSRVLNHRRISFRGQLLSTFRSSMILSKQILKRILKICQNSSDKNSINPDITDWIEFSEKVSLLQSVSLYDLTKEDLIAFFLNVYHTLLLHAFIVLGVPSSNTDWRTLKTTASYEIAGDLITLKDIDEIILGNISNRVVLFTFLRVQISQNDALKQIESKRPKQLDPTLMFPFSRLYFGELWDYSIPISHVPLKDIINTYNCDWRVALCITNGYCDMSNHIYIYDGLILNEQLDKRCKDILLNRVRVDSSPPSILSSTPSISLPKSLSCLIPLTSSIVNGRSSPYEILPSPTSTTPTTLISPKSRSTTSTSTSTSNNNLNNNLNNDDPRLWLPVLSKYIRSDTYKIIEQLIQNTHKIYIVFDIPDYSHFKFLQLKLDDSFSKFNNINDENEEDDENEILRENNSEVTIINHKKEKESLNYTRYSMNDTLTKINMIESVQRSSDSLIEHDRSISLDSAREVSPLKMTHQNSNSLTNSSLQINLFSENQPSFKTITNSKDNGDNNSNNNNNNRTISNSLTTGKPPIPSNNSKNLTKRTSIEDLRFALQSEPSTIQGNNITKTKKKGFFGWK